MKFRKLFSKRLTMSTSFIRFCNLKRKLTSVKMTQSINAAVAFVATVSCAWIVGPSLAVYALFRQSQLQLQTPGLNKKKRDVEAKPIVYAAKS